MNGAQRLRQEIFYLAYHLHWSWSEVMALEITERHHYVHMLAQRIEDENKALETFAQTLKAP